MRVLAVILLFYAIYCIAEHEKRILRKIPKKVSSGFVKYLNYNRFLPESTKKTNINKNYTVFQGVLPNERNVNIPDSPYFPVEVNVDHKIRVKKVLPAYIPRKKRSAGNKEVAKDFKDVKETNIRNSDKTKHKHKERQAIKNKKHKKGKSKQSKNKKSNNKGKKHKKSANKSPKDTRRLIAGKDALIEEYPYMVSIQKDNQHWCSGALLTPRLVITTANCVWKATTISRMRVRVGSRYVDHGGQMAKIQEVMRHPYWGIRKNPDNDVALMVLDRDVRFSDKVHSVDLPNRVMMPAFEDAWITSWGSERRDGVYDKRTLALHVYHAKLVDHKKCNNVTKRFGVRVTENFICLSQSGKRAPCTRDTGAPAVSDGILWGLASWGIRKLCGTERFPAMFSYLASHSNMDFITNATRSLMADHRYYPFLDRYPQMSQ